MWRVFGYSFCFRVPPVCGLRCWGFRCLLAWVVCVGVFFSCFGVFAMSSLPSLSSLSPVGSVAWGSPVVVDRLGWCASSRSVLVWASGSGAEPLRCRVGRSPSAAVSALVASLRAARDSRLPVCLGVRSGWSPERWFCAVAPASARACALADARMSAALGRPLKSSLSGVRELALEVAGSAA